MLLTCLRGLNTDVAWSSCNPGENVLPLLVVGHWLCTEFARPQGWNLFFLFLFLFLNFSCLTWNSVFTWFSCNFCNCNYSNDELVTPNSEVLLFVWYQSFIEITVTSSFSVYKKIFMTLTKICMKKYRPGMKADALRSGDTRCSGEEYRHGMIRVKVQVDDGDPIALNNLPVVT